MWLHQVDVVGNGLAYRPQCFLACGTLCFFQRIELLLLRGGAHLVRCERGQYDQAAPDGGRKGEVQTGDEAGSIQQDNQTAYHGLGDEEDGSRQGNPGLGRGNAAPAPY